MKLQVSRQTPTTAVAETVVVVRIVAEWSAPAIKQTYPSANRTEQSFDRAERRIRRRARLDPADDRPGHTGGGRELALAQPGRTAKRSHEVIHLHEPDAAPVV